MLEVFRAVVVRAIRDKWPDKPPRVPPTKQEIKGLLKLRQEVDEYRVLCRLAGLGSRSAGVTTILRPTKAVVKEALRDRRRRRAAQITLVAIPGATRFRVYQEGRPLPTRCGRCRHVEDSFDHLPRCYGLLGDYQTGEQSVEFFVKMARRSW